MVGSYCVLCRGSDSDVISTYDIHPASNFNTWASILGLAEFRASLKEIFSDLSATFAPENS